MPITQYDIDNIETILASDRMDWFTAKLLRLMRDADMDNLQRLATVFPDEFVAFARWKWGSLPYLFNSIGEVRFANSMLDEPLEWAYPMVKSGRDF